MTINQARYLFHQALKRVPSSGWSSRSFIPIAWHVFSFFLAGNRGIFFPAFALLVPLFSLLFPASSSVGPDVAVTKCVRHMCAKLRSHGYIVVSLRILIKPDGGETAVASGSQWQQQQKQKQEQQQTTLTTAEREVRNDGNGSNGSGNSSYRGL